MFTVTTDVPVTQVRLPSGVRLDSDTLAPAIASGTRLVETTWVTALAPAELRSG